MEGVAARGDQIEDAIQSRRGARQLQRRAGREAEAAETRDPRQEEILVASVVRNVQERAGARVTLGDVEALR